MTNLTVTKREKITKKENARLRAEGSMPAVVYGPKEAATSIAIPLVDFKKAWKEAGESTVVTLTGLGEDKDVLIHDVDIDPVFGEPRHADLYAIEKGKKVQVAVPLEFVGISPAEKSLGGTLIKVLHEIEIEALPKDLPHEIEVSIESLVDFESQVLVQDIKLPHGVEVITEGEEVVALVQEARDTTEDEASPVAAPDMAAIEISEDRGKKEEEGGEEK